jgi:hypothetical protein
MVPMDATTAAVIVVAIFALLSIYGPSADELYRKKLRE